MISWRDDLQISVVVACFRQADPLDLVLSSFLDQSFPRSEYEIIVVDDHSPDHAARRTVGRTRAHYPDARVHYVRHHRPDGGQYGASAVVKNIGLRLASGRYVYFNNAEICQAGETLNRIAERMATSQEPLCLRGRVLDLEREALAGLSPFELEVLHDRTDHTRERVASADHAGLAAVPRMLLLQVGGNDERFDHWGKEDLDLAARLKRAGCVYVYDESLKSFHVSHPINFRRGGDYQRMAELLSQNNAAALVEANRGRLWGQLQRPPNTAIEASLLVEAGADSRRLSEKLERLLFGEGAPLIEVAVCCRDELRPRTEKLLEARFKTVPLFSLPDTPEQGCLTKLAAKLIAPTVLLCLEYSDALSWEELKTAARSGGWTPERCSVLLCPGDRRAACEAVSISDGTSEGAMKPPDAGRTYASGWSLQQWL